MMARFGLSPGTLKGELFTILSLKGNSGMKISELATFSSVSNSGHPSKEFRTWSLNILSNIFIFLHEDC